MKMCEFLKSRSDVNLATLYLSEHNLLPHNLECKNWDLAHILSDISDGNFLDMGSSESYILHNIIRKGAVGEKFGIDFRSPDHPLPGVKYIIGDIMKTTFGDNLFQNISCLSVIEHGVELNRLALEVKRILKVGGKFYLTFDYWDPKVITTSVKLYGLPWGILDKVDVIKLIEIFKQYGLILVDELDWTISEQVIQDGYFTPFPGFRYTFGFLTFSKVGQ
jgi:SAM-dependent methyltransferase